VKNDRITLMAVEYTLAQLVDDDASFLSCFLPFVEAIAFDTSSSYQELSVVLLSSLV
jgi:hypothetical protein